MLALLPENIEVQMFRKIAAVAALWLPTFAQAEIIELSCQINDMPSVGIVKLVLDTSNHRVRFGNWDWSSASMWTDDLVLWASFSVDPFSNAPSVGSFIFKRTTGELAIRSFSEWTFYELPPEAQRNMYLVRNCYQPF